MIPVKDILDVVSKDFSNSAVNGDLNFDRFNRLSPIAELRIRDYATGDIEDLKPPFPYSSLKVRELLTDHLKSDTQIVKNGRIFLQDDYYIYDTINVKGGTSVPVTMLNKKEFDYRCNTAIRPLLPSYEQPIGTKQGRELVFSPGDLGVVEVNYYPYPKYAKIVSKIDTRLNKRVVDEDESINYEYNDWARELLIYFISEMAAGTKRDTELVQLLKARGKLVRDEK